MIISHVVLITTKDIKFQFRLLDGFLITHKQDYVTITTQGHDEIWSKTSMDKIGAYDIKEITITFEER
jgi:repressor of nif and glnA expression